MANTRFLPGGLVGGVIRTVFWCPAHESRYLLLGRFFQPLIMTEPRKKVGVFVDVQNIYYTTRDAYSRQFNYRALWQCLTDMGEVVQACAYAIDSGNVGQQKFQRALSAIGFDVKLKPYIQRRDGSAKGDWDVGITIDVLEAAVDLDIVVLLSGDGDFDMLLRKIIETQGVEAHVYGVPQLTANSLIDAATRFHPITADLLL